MSTATRPPRAPALSAVRPLPPGPRLPRWAQTLGFVVGGVRFLEACRRRYGDVVTMGTLFDDRFVLVFDPALVKDLFQGPPGQLRAGEANALLGPILGERSVLLLDGDEHLRHRRLMAGPFHGRRMLDHVETMRACADAEIDAWPVDQPFRLLDRFQALTLRIIVRTVFGYSPGAAEDELSARLRAMVEPLSRARGLLMVSAAVRGGRERESQRRFEARKGAVDEIIYAEIARRRADPDLDQRDDVFSALVGARDEDGVGLSDREVRDELVTLLLAGHETTATGLAWTLDLVLHDDRVRELVRAGDEAYLDATVKEALRLRPVIPGVGRVVRERPFALGPYEVPVGVEINPSIRVMHRRGDLYPSPRAFLPERFLGDDAPDTYTWVPFGGGSRRCLGASFALTEMRIVLGRVLERAALAPVDPEPAKTQFRAITLAPKGGVPVVLQRAPVPARPVSAGAVV
ncbi:MAG TPA: cytochrome P450 [Solirubrobacteraceae bacterium]|jgi:cytochrome P450|nr:cytochrome P450 [Solirubrobacteraceae bacterium]